MADNKNKLQKSSNGRSIDFRCDKKDVSQLKKQSKDDVKNYILGLSQLWAKCSKELPADDPRLCNIAGELCSQLLQTKNMGDLELFLDKLPETCDYSFNEQIIRANIFLSMYKGDTKKVYKLIEVCLASCFLCTFLSHSIRRFLKVCFVMVLKEIA